MLKLITPVVLSAILHDDSSFSADFMATANNYDGQSTVHKRRKLAPKSLMEPKGIL